MKQKLLSLLVTMVAMFGCLGSLQAQEYTCEWTISSFSGNTATKTDAQNVTFSLSGNVVSFEKASNGIFGIGKHDARVKIAGSESEHATFSFTDPQDKKVVVKKIVINAAVSGINKPIKLSSNVNSTTTDFANSIVHQDFDVPSQYISNNFTELYMRASSSGDAYIYKITITYELQTKATMTINGGIGTFCAPFDVTIPDGVTAYTYTQKSGDYAIFTSIDNGTIPAGTPVLTKGTQPANNVFYGVATVTDATCGSGFEGNLGASKTADNGSYVLYNGEFHPVGNNVTIGTNKCYFASGALSAKTRIMFVDSNEETAISAASSVEPKVSAIYSVSGAAITKMQKGINIVKYSDGTTKKVLVK